MKKIAIFILHPWYISSWYDTKLISDLSARYQVTIISSSDIINFCRNTYPAFEQIRYEEIFLPKVKFVTRAYSFISIIINRKRNPSFNFRLKNLVWGEVNLVPSPFSWKFFFICVWINLRHLTKYGFRYWYQIPMYIPVFNKLIYFIIKLWFKMSFTKNRFNLKKDYDYVIFVSGAIELSFMEIIKQLKPSKTKTILCIENWDNLTSKRFLIEHPDYTLVMGSSTAKLVSEIQKMPKNTIVSAGIPRFNPYRNLTTRLTKNYSQLFSILYVGCYLPHDEISLLNTLAILLDDSGLKDKYQIIYKPHPGARERFIKSKLNHTSIKVNMTNNRRNPTINNQHISLMINSDVIIATPTSMIIEALLLRKKILLDLTNDGVHRTSAKRAYETHIHFTVLNEIKELIKCFTVQEMAQQLVKVFQVTSPDFIQYSTDKLIENLEASYSNHLINIIK